MEVARHGDSDVTVDLVREEWALPRLDLEKDVWLVEDDRGLAAYGFCWVEPRPARSSPSRPWTPRSAAEV